MLAVALIGVAVAFLQSLADLVSSPLASRDPFEQAPWASIVFASRASVCAVVLWGLLFVRRRLHRRKSEFEGEPATSARKKTTLLDVGFFLAGLALATGYVLLTAARQPFPREYLLLEGIAGAVVYGMVLGFLGILACQYALRGRRQTPWTGEWLGVTTAALLLATILLESPLTRGVGPRVFVLLCACCLIQCVLSIMSVAFVVARLFTRHRPGLRVQPPRTNILGYLVCAVAGPFSYWQLCAGLLDI